MFLFLLVEEVIVDACLLAHVLEQPVEKLADPQPCVHALHGMVVQQPNKQPEFATGTIGTI